MEADIGEGSRCFHQKLSPECGRDYASPFFVLEYVKVIDLQ